MTTDPTSLPFTTRASMLTVWAPIAIDMVAARASKPGTPNTTPVSIVCGPTAIVPRYESAGPSPVVSAASSRSIVPTSFPSSMTR
jgi:hypothetical protein